LYKEFPLLRSKTTSTAYPPIKLLGLEERLKPNSGKNIVQIEHTRHRSIGGFATNLMATMPAYSFLPKSHHFNIEIIERERRIA
jgi:transposase, IS4 family (fragment)